MATWTLVLVQSPLNRTGTGIVGQLALASAPALTFDLHAAATLSFSLPSNHYRTPAVVPKVSDVLAYRDGVLVNRFRVTGRTLGLVTCSYVASAYRARMGERIFFDGDQLDWPASLSGTAEQTEIAWEIIQQTQSKTRGDLGITLGHTPAAAVQVSAWVNDVSGNTTPQHFFSIGAYVGDEIGSKLADVSGGFEWDIECDPAHPSTGLVFNSWNAGDRGKDYGAGSLTITESSFPSGTDSVLVQDGSDFWNVGRYQGGAETVNGANLLGPVVLRPTTGNPDLSPAEGRWEKSDTQPNVLTSDAVASYAARQEVVGLLGDRWTVPLADGIWQGPGHAWLGDYVRILLKLRTWRDDGQEGDKLLSVDTLLRVMSISVTVAAGGAEQVTLALNLPAKDFLSGLVPNRLSERLAALERKA